MFPKLLFPTLLLLLFAAALRAQDLRGTVTDSDDGQPVANASVVLSSTGKIAATDANGQFLLRGATCPTARCTLSISLDGYTPGTYEFPSNSLSLDPVSITLRRIPPPVEEETAKPADIPTVTLEEAESETEGAAEVANVLNASQDVFQRVSNFGWGAFRFRERGYDGGLFQTFINGMPFNDLETGFTSFGEFGGLNDVFRLRSSTVGLDPAEFSFGGPGGSTLIDTRASSQRKQIRASYASSNRTYRNRIMLTASTGLMPGGWAVTLSGSHRWADEGYVPGTFMDAWAYFVGIDKKFGSKHTLSLTVFGAPTKRGRAGDSFQEMYDLAGSNFYNPNWGYQNGQKRNASMGDNHQPTAILRYDWTPSTKTNLMATLYAQSGKNDLTRINFVSGKNPNPDFNRRLPSSFENPEMAALQADMLRRDEGFRQVNWEAFYDANRLNNVTVQNPDGKGESLTGLNSIYVLANDRSLNTEAGLNLIVNHTFNPRLTLNGGALYQYYLGKNYRVVDDLLGGEFFVDWDFLGNFDNPANQTSRNNDLLNPNNVVREGEKFGWDFDENIRKSNAWAQLQYSLPRWQFFGAAEGGQTQMWRTGYMQSGRFPDNSLGDSEKLSFTTYGAKGGIVYKATGRNYFYVNGYYGTRAPFFRSAFFQARNRDLTVPNLTVSKTQSVEGGYLLRSPNYRARVTGYVTDFKDETESIFASQWSVSRVLSEMDLATLNLSGDPAAIAAALEQPFFFGSTILQGVGRRHMGVEAAIEAKPLTSWVFTAAASVGSYRYTERPNALVSLDNSKVLLPAITIYQKDFYVPRTPQTAASAGVRYEGKQFWFASLSLNYAAQSWYDFDRVRRTQQYVTGLVPDSPIWNTIIDQKNGGENFTLDFFGGKSFMIERGGKRYFINFNLGVNNILDNQNIVLSGRDAYRNAFRNDVSDPRFYTNELLYAFGLNYFASVTLRM
jgi:hypothetical protein